MHQEQYQKSQGVVMQFHWKIAQEFTNKCLWESLYFCGSQSFISVCSSCPLDQFTPKLFVIKQDLQITFISTNIAHDFPNHHSTTAQRPAKITAFKDQRMGSNIFYSHWKEWENTVTGIQQTRTYQKLHHILNKELQYEVSITLTAPEYMQLSLLRFSKPECHTTLCVWSSH